MDSIREQGRTYIEKRLRDTANPIVIPEMQLQVPKVQKADIPKHQTEHLEKKKAVLHAPDIAKIAKVEWKDPPPPEKTVSQ